MSEDALYNDVTKGHQAQTLLDNKLLQEAFEYIEQTHVSGWRTANTKETREQHWYSLQAIEKLKSRLNKYISDGKMASVMVAQQIEAQNRARRNNG